MGISFVSIFFPLIKCSVNTFIQFLDAFISVRDSSSHEIIASKDVYILNISTKLSKKAVAINILSLMH